MTLTKKQKQRNWAKFKESHARRRRERILNESELSFRRKRTASIDNKISARSTVYKDIKIQELHAANVELRLEIDDLQLKNLKII
ncbi:12183_t:CDS:2 [Funneliformis mosseae]|uniref:12183_t:CDS:1 n=1 Tax=Funneliformis mosseae TaxID=27381 RepID=A0A9N8ZUG0_FUNMO|nr:12183_t:CDS:2 [Funneliformis mosseae]